jgi:hypothetical protein
MNPMAQSNVYYVAFFTKDHPKEAGNIPPDYMSAVKITIEMDALPPEFGDLAEKYSVNLADDPLYNYLRRYCVANMPRGRS